MQRTVARGADRPSAIPARWTMRRTRVPSGSPPGRPSRPARSSRSSAPAPCPASRRCETARTCARSGTGTVAPWSRRLLMKITSPFAPLPKDPRPISNCSGNTLARPSTSTRTPPRSTPSSPGIRRSHHWSPGYRGSACRARSTGSSSSCARSSDSRCPSPARGHPSAASSRARGPPSSDPSEGSPMCSPRRSGSPSSRPSRSGCLARAPKRSGEWLPSWLGGISISLATLQPARRSACSRRSRGSDRGRSPTSRCARSATQMHSCRGTSASGRGSRCSACRRHRRRCSRERNGGDHGVLTRSCTSGTLTREPTGIRDLVQEMKGGGAR